MTGAELALPHAAHVMRLGQLERGILGDERPGPCRV
jgi:hypothetical protein